MYVVPPVANLLVYGKGKQGKSVVCKKKRERDVTYILRSTYGVRT